MVAGSLRRFDELEERLTGPTALNGMGVAKGDEHLEAA